MSKYARSGGSSSAASKATSKGQLPFPFATMGGRKLSDGHLCFHGSLTLEFLTDVLGVSLEKIVENTRGGEFSFKPGQREAMEKHYGADKAEKLIQAFNRPVITKSKELEQVKAQNALLEQQLAAMTAMQERLAELEKQNAGAAVS